MDVLTSNLDKGYEQINLEINKYLCMDQLIGYESHCPTDFIYNTKLKYMSDKEKKGLWTQDDLDLINWRRNHSHELSMLENGAMFEDPKLNKRGKFIVIQGFATIERK